MTRQEIQDWIYGLKKVTPLEAYVLLNIYHQTGLNAAVDRLDAVDKSYPQLDYAGVWLWELEGNRNLKDKILQMRSRLLEQYCTEGKENVHLTGQQAFYELSFFAQYETSYGTLQYYEDIYRQLCQVNENDRDAWYLLALIRIRNSMKETIYEYQAQIGCLFKETFQKLSKAWCGLSCLEKSLVLTAGFEAASAKVLLSYKYRTRLNEWYRQLGRTELSSDDERAGAVLADIARIHLDRVDGRLRQ